MKGTLNWNNGKSFWFIQDRSTIETIIRKQEIEDFGINKPALWLETCGSHSATNAALSIQPDPDKFLRSFSTPGGEPTRPPDVLTLFLNAPQNSAELKAIRPDIDVDKMMGNQVPQFYPLAVSRIFGVKADFQWIHNFNKVASLVSAGSAVQICLVKPGHYLCVIAYDEVNNKLIYVDPHPPRHPDGNWYNATMDKQEYDSNTQNFAIVYSLT